MSTRAARASALLFLSIGTATALAWAQTPTPALDARASDPVALGWMVGSPPPPDKVITFADGSFFRFPQIRWSFSHYRELVPTRTVSRGRAPVAQLPRAERTDLDAVTFTPMGGTSPMTWAQSLDANYTDGIVVLHRGRVVYEKYFGVLDADRPHIAFSVTKSVVALLAGSLIAEGVLDETVTVGQYVPELASSGLGDATLRQLLDMTTGADYTEVYTDENSPVWAHARASGLLPRRPGDTAPLSTLAYLWSLRKAYPNGKRFTYKTVNTDALAAVMRRVTRESLATLTSERLHARLGAEQDAYFLIDSTGAEFAGGGLNLTLRDLARYGEMVRLGGRYQGHQIVPAAVIEDIRRGGNRDQFAGAGYKTLPGWSYRSQWWVSHDSHGTFCARGIHGQGIYIDPAAEMVIARFASHPTAGNVNIDPTTLPAYEAIAKHLMR